MNKGQPLDEVGVLVLGMHRSGTSVASRLVNLLGLPFSAPDDVTSRPAPGNSTAIWESAALRDFNDSLLRELGGDRWAPPEIEGNWAQQVDDSIRDRAVETFRSVYVTPQWVWKDPRNCLTLPFWRSTIAARPVCIVIYRNPLDVAGSLAKRDGHDRALGLALWERYTRELLGNIEGLPVVVTAYNDLVDDPLGWCNEVSAFLAAEGVSLSPIPEEAIVDLVDASLRNFHSVPEALDTDGLVSASIRDTYMLLTDLRGAHRAFPIPDLPGSTGWVDSLLIARRGLATATRHVAALENRLRKRPKPMRTQNREAVLERQLSRERRRARALEAKLNRLYSSRTFRYLRPLRVLAAGIRGNRKLR